MGLRGKEDGSLAPDGSVVLAVPRSTARSCLGGTTVGHSAIAAPLPCTQAAARLVAVPVVEGAFRLPPLGKGHLRHPRHRRRSRRQRRAGRRPHRPLDPMARRAMGRVLSGRVLTVEIAGLSGRRWAPADRSQRRARPVLSTMTWVGLDVHARSVHAAAIDAETGELRRARLGGGSDEVVRFLSALRGPVRAVYEAGPTGFGLARARPGGGRRDGGGGAGQDAARRGRAGEDRSARRGVVGAAADGRLAAGDSRARAKRRRRRGIWCGPARRCGRI